MLRRLLRKDLILNGKAFASLLWLFVWIGFAAGQMKAVGLALMVGAVAATLMTATLGAREDRFHSTSVVFSLPLTRRDVVLYRLLGGYVMGMAAFVLACLLMTALPWSRHTLVELFDPRTVVYALVVISVAVSTSMPLVLRFGPRGLFVGLGGLQALGLLGLGLGAAIAGILVVRAGFVAIEKSVVSVIEGLGSGIQAMLALSVVGLIALVSYRWSVFLVQRRDV